jgi:hypothetical protein
MPWLDPKDLMTVLGWSMVILIWLTIIFLLIFAFSGCAVTRIEGECILSREITTTYYCEPGGKLESFKVQPQPND